MAYRRGLLSLLAPFLATAVCWTLVFWFSAVTPHRGARGALVAIGLPAFLVAMLALSFGYRRRAMILSLGTALLAGAVFLLTLIAIASGS